VPLSSPISPWQSENTAKFQQALLGWFDKHKRKLPWRTHTSLYRTVVSEFMLQQTRVDTVIRYFENWMQRFPDFVALAQASEADVLKAWEGLGYYRRARNLHALAQRLASMKHIPDDEAFWFSLPGIGPYSAAAIRSIALGQPSACVDGNVVRIITRLRGDETCYRDSSTASRLLNPLASSLISTQRPGSFNEAMMELGATVCTPRNPLCTVCPVQAFCTGHSLPHLQEIPCFAKTHTLERTAQRLFLLHQGNLLLQQTPVGKTKRLESFMELPHLPENWLTHPHISLLCTRKRGISQERWTENIYGMNSPEDALQWAIHEPSLRWVNTGQLSDILLSGPHRKWINDLLAKR
jgi:A/G-specific adenine glycosylase